MDIFENRLFSFKKWPLHYPDILIMAACGFYYTLKDDLVMCAFCKVAIDNWTLDDNVYTEHKKFSPFCPYLKSNFYFKTVSKNKNISVNVVYPEYKNFNNRLTSLQYFENKKNLALKGLFLNKNKVTCYFCGYNVPVLENNNHKCTYHYLIEDVSVESNISLQCTICMINKINVAFTCGHVSCSNCVLMLLNCHMCRQKITTINKIYI